MTILAATRIFEGIRLTTSYIGLVVVSSTCIQYSSDELVDFKGILACVCACMHVCVCVYACVCMHECMCMDVCACVYVHACMCVCVCVRACV
jgi:hypothetical protein